MVSKETVLMDTYLHPVHVIGIYIPFLLVAIFIFYADLNRHSRTKRGGVLPFMCFCVVGWVICEITVLWIDHEGVRMLVGYGLRIFSLFTVSAQVLLSYWFFRADYKLPAYVAFLFILLPVGFAFAALTPLYYLAFDLYDLRGGIAEGISDVVIHPPGDTIPLWDLWVFLSILYYYAMVVASFFILLIGFFLRARFYRLPSLLMLGGSAATLGVNALAFFGVGMTTNFVIIVFCVSLVLYHLAILNHESNFYARYARLQAFNFLKDFVIITGKKGQIADFNSSANKWFSSIGIDLRNLTIKSVLDKLTEMGAKLTPEPGADSKGKDITYLKDGFTVILNMRVFDMVDRKRLKHGSIVFFFDVTENRELFETLEKKAGVDPLSGLPNRMAYDGALARYNSPDHMPLSIVMCDLNGLKAVNDNMGHKYGDLLIQTAARIVEKACQAPHFVARLGGDEFVFLLSKTNEQGAKEMITGLKEVLAEESKSLPFVVSLAMGAATKQNVMESTDEAIADADARMYADKKAMKIVRGELIK